MSQVPGDDRCQHGEIAAWCGESELNYRHEAGRRVAVKDQAELRPAGSSRRLDVWMHDANGVVDQNWFSPVTGAIGDWSS
jgi:hypothetical protein